MRKQVFYILFVLSLVSVLGFSYISDIAEQSPLIGCHKWGFYSTKGIKYYTNPEELVVQPWRGRHHVYGVFIIPDGYKSDRLITLTIPGSKTYCGSLLNDDNSFTEEIPDKPGFYKKRGYLNTRTAIWIIAQGKGDQLEQPSNWRLGYIVIKKNPTSHKHPGNTSSDKTCKQTPNHCPDSHTS